MATARRRLLIVLIATALIVSAGGWLGWRAIAKPQPVRAYERLRLGMTKNQVDAAIGMPPGWYTEPKLGGIMSGPHVHYVRASGIPSVSLPTVDDRDTPLTLEQWTWDDYWIRVAFDEDGKAVGCYLLESSGPGYDWSLLDRLRAFVGF
jgi:hypothetical protein